MIIDSSAFVAVALEEPDSDDILSLMAHAPQRRTSAATWLESCIVIDRRKRPAVTARFEQMLARLKTEIVPVDAEQIVAARLAHQRFGRGNHPAQLNYGDCFAYALAKVTGEPLLFKGNDFSQTDITPALRA